LAWVDAQDGHLSAALGQLWAAADSAAVRGQLCLEIIILGDLLRLGEHRAAPRAQDLSQNVDGAWSAAIAAHAIAVRSSAPAALEAAAHAFSGIGSSLVAAELWASASLAYTNGGLRARAAAASRESGRLLVLCEGALTAVLSTARTPDPLTRREREITTLAAQGATNAQIAAELSVSVRTVESHMYLAFAKLGITSRSELEDALRQ
jgi:DNA-binding NarL/FixJ family response regulator